MMPLISVLFIFLSAEGKRTFAWDMHSPEEVTRHSRWSCTDITGPRRVMVDEHVAIRICFRFY